MAAVLGGDGAARVPLRAGRETRARPGAETTPATAAVVVEALRGVVHGARGGGAPARGAIVRLLGRVPRVQSAAAGAPYMLFLGSVDANTHACMYACTHARMHARTRVRAPALAQHAFSHTHRRAHTLVHTHARTCTHNTGRPSRPRTRARGVIRGVRRRRTARPLPATTDAVADRMRFPWQQEIERY